MVRTDQPGPHSQQHVRRITIGYLIGRQDTLLHVEPPGWFRTSPRPLDEHAHEAVGEIARDCWKRKAPRRRHSVVVRSDPVHTNGLDIKRSRYLMPAKPTRR